MADSSPERSAARLIRARSILIGAALAIVTVVGASLLLSGGPRLLQEVVSLVALVVVGLLVGIWVGAPGAERDELPIRQRWAVAGLATAAAGAFATAWSLYQSLISGALGGTLALLLLIAIPTYALGMALPVLVASGDRWEEVLGDERSEWGSVGTVVMGTLIGLGAGAFLAGLVFVPMLTAGPTLLALSILLLAPLVMAEPEFPEVEERLLHEIVTPFSHLRVTELDHPGERQPERRLYLNGEEESAEQIRSGAPALAYVAAAETWLMTTTPRGSTFLFLGGGAYTLPRRMAERDPRARIVVVELDPEVTRVAQQYFGLRREHRIVSVHGDARAFLSRPGEHALYDRIYLDVYAGAEALPFALVTQEAFGEMAEGLREGGVAAMNLIGETNGPEMVRLWSVVKTFATIFPSVALYSHLGRDYPERQNLLLAGSMSPDHQFPPRAGLFDRWKREEWPDVSAAVVYRDLAAAPRAAPAAEGVGVGEQKL